MPAKWLKFADQVMVLDHGGQLSAVGAPNTLASSNIYVREMMLSQKSHDQQITESEEKDEEDIPISSKDRAASTHQMIEVGRSKPPESDEEARLEVAQSSALRYYISMMGKGSLLTFGALVLLHIACSTAQRESAPSLSRSYMFESDIYLHGYF